MIPSGLHRLPGDKPQHDTVLNAGDLITAVELGAPAPRSTYHLAGSAQSAAACASRLGRSSLQQSRPFA